MFWLSPVIFMFCGNDINGEKILISQLIKNSRYLPFHAVKLCGIYCCFLSVSHTHLHIPFVYFDSCISFLSRCVPKHFHLILQKALKVTKFKCLKIVERLMGIIIATNSSLHQAQPSQPVVVVRLFNNFKSISCCKIV